MNQLEVPFGRDPRELLAESVAGAGLPPPAPSSTKKHDGPEVDQDDDEQSQQQQDSELTGGHDGDNSGNQGAANGSLDTACEPMVTYDGFESVGKPFGLAARPRFGLVDDDDDDVVNVCSPIVCKPSGSGASRSRAMSPTCVSALARDAVVKDKEDDLEEPLWSIQEFQEYLGMLELLQEMCGNSEGEEVSLSADSLSQMERLLTSLLPQGA